MLAQITLIIAHNHYIFRGILDNILESYAGICVLAKVDNAADLFEKTKELKPDVVLAGMELPGMNDVAEWEKLIAHCGETKVVISWRHRHADKLPKMMRISCAGYIAHDASPAEYIYAIKQAARGKEFHCSQTQKLWGSPNEMAAFVKSLDDKWKQLLCSICMGYSNEEIAMATRFKVSTVKSYRKKLKGITGFRSVAALENILNEFKVGKSEK
jgi:DNA-binding NarL/FixJ family response regulator